MSSAAPVTAIRIFKATVVASERLNPHFQRVTLGGGDLAEFESISPDQFIYVFVPRPGEDDPRVEHGFSWDEWRAAPEPERQVGRYYTVRRHDRDKGELTLDFVLHGDGPLTSWANRAAPGERVAIWGPRKGFDPPAGVSNFLLFADETGLPALAAIVESLPADATARAFVEVPDLTAIQNIGGSDGVEWTWLARDGATSGETDLLAEAVMSAPLPEAPFYAWGGGEFRAMNTLRKHLRAAGITAADMSIIAYWRHPAHTEDGAEGH